MRGLAAVYVAVAHAIGAHSWWLKFGQEAVMVFFLLSGFVIEYTFARSPRASFSSFFLKRWVRIYPPILLLFAVVALLGNTESEQTGIGTILLGNLAMLQDFDVGKPNVIVPPLFSPALWSLHYEWWFYMLFFPLRRYLPPCRATRCVAIAAIGAAVVYGFWPHVVPRLVLYFITWWTGVVMAQSYRKHGRVQLADLRFALFGLVAVTTILAINAYHAYTSGARLSLGIHPILELRHVAASLVVVLAALVWQRFAWRGFGPLMIGTWVAPISYTLYIGHQPLFAYAQYGSGIENPWSRGLLHLGVLVLFCYLVELRLHPWLHRRLRAKRGTPPLCTSTAASPRPDRI